MRTRKALLGGLCLLLSMQSPGSSSVNDCPNSSTTTIAISKSRRTLQVCSPQGQKVYKCSFGKGELLEYDRKSRQGDNKTPEGTYTIVEKHPSKTFNYFLGLDYPNTEDAASGLRSGIISEAEYRSIHRAQEAGIMPPQLTRLGGRVGIHGEKQLDFVSLGPWVNWTRGCISVSNNDAKELYETIPVGTEVVIHR